MYSIRPLRFYQRKKQTVARIPGMHSMYSIDSASMDGVRTYVSINWKTLVELNIGLTDSNQTIIISRIVNATKWNPIMAEDELQRYIDI